MSDTLSVLNQFNASDSYCKAYFPENKICSGHGYCNPGTAVCICDSGWRGLLE